MVWKGAFGSFIGIDEFASFQVPFESQFEDWSGGSKNNGFTKHFTRFGEGNYTCSGGWPSLTDVNVKPFLNQEPTQKRVLMRVCDWWRREHELLVENWCCRCSPCFITIEPAFASYGKVIEMKKNFRNGFCKNN